MLVCVRVHACVWICTCTRAYIGTFVNKCKCVEERLTVNVVLHMCRQYGDSLPFLLHPGRECQVKHWKNHKPICDVMVVTGKTL